MEFNNVNQRLHNNDKNKKNKVNNNNESRDWVGRLGCGHDMTVPTQIYHHWLK